MVPLDPPLRVGREGDVGMEEGPLERERERAGIKSVPATSVLMLGLRKKRMKIVSGGAQMLCCLVWPSYISVHLYCHETQINSEHPVNYGRTVKCDRATYGPFLAPG